MFDAGRKRGGLAEIPPEPDDAPARVALLVAAEALEAVAGAAFDSDADVFSVRGASRLVLITCGGAYDPANGGYQDNLVVIARPDGPVDVAP